MLARRAALTMPLAHLARNLWSVARREGPAAVWRSFLHRASERYWERHFGVETGAVVNTTELGFADRACHLYAAANYIGLFDMLHRLQPGPADSFLDYGCGKGRALLVAATFPFRRVAGVELSAPLCAEARANLDRARRRFRCSVTEVIHAAADTYPVPADVTIAYFFNAFSGAVLAGTLDRLRASLRAHPRDLRFVCRFPARCAAELELGHVPDLALVESHDRTPDDRCRIYRFRP